MRESVHFFWLSIFLFLSCNSVKVKVSANDKRNAHPDKAHLIKIGEKMFPLDSLTAQNTESVYYFESSKDSIGYISFLNGMARRVYFYDYDHQKPVSVTSYQKDGPMGVGQVTGHFVESKDSIYMLDPWGSKLSIIDPGGVKLASYSLSPSNNVAHNKNIILPIARLSCVEPMLISDGKLFLTGNDYGEFNEENSTNRPVITTYNISDRVLNYTFSYPDIYQGANWGAQNYRDIFSTFNKAKKTLLISFPADHYIYEYNTVTKSISRYYAGSSHFGDITSLDKKKSFFDKEYFYMYFGTHPSYSSIVYDKYRDLYYRFTDLPISDYDGDVKEKSVKQFSIIILNNKFERIGETVLPLLSHSRLSFFVSRDGLLLKKYTKDEDHLTFSIFAPQPIN